MTDETNTTNAPEGLTFEAVAVADLPKQDRGSSPEQIAMGKALLAVLTPEQGARDPMAHTERTAAVNRAQVIKRAVRAAGGAPDGFRLATQIESREDGYHVIATLAKVTEKAAAKGSK